MSVTAAKGFRAAGIRAGIANGTKKDLAVIVNDGPIAAAAAVFTTNRVKAAPVVWTEQALRDPEIRAVVLNAGGANACTGDLGYEDAMRTAERAAAALDITAQDVALCSTGLIGERLPLANVLSGVDIAVTRLTDDLDGGAGAAEAIMTTDTVPKTVVVSGSGYTIGAMAKGAGMLAPSLATMLVLITTDADVKASQLDGALHRGAARTLGRIDSDGCMSTNDTLLLMASGASGVQPDPMEFEQLVEQVCADIARQLLADAEGSTKDIGITVVNAAGEADAVDVARTVARSNLLKCAIHGEDPNWGRVLAAIGTTAARFDPSHLSVAFNDVWVCRNGGVGEDRTKVDLTGRHVDIVIDLDAGRAEATIWTNDLTAGYVHENSAVLDMTALDVRQLDGLRRLDGQVVVLKFGGNAMVDPALEDAFASDVAALRSAGVFPVVVHGGGPQISAALDALGIETTFADGLRVTTPEVLRVVRMVLAGQIQRDLVNCITRNGSRAAGITGEDGGLLLATQRSEKLGLVGDVIKVRSGLIRVLLEGDYVPVVSSIGVTVDGTVLNLNADTAAGALAAGLGAAELVMLTDVPCLYADWPANETPIDNITPLELEAMLPSLSSGMIPKMRGVLEALQGGVGTARIVDGRVAHSSIAALAGEHGGTVVTA